MNDVYLCKALGEFLEAGLSDFLLPLEHKADEPTVFRAPKIRIRAKRMRMAAAPKFRS